MSAPHEHPLSTPAAWRGAELFERRDWEVGLSDANMAELAAAMRDTEGRPLDAVERGAFALPQLGPKLTAVQDALETGAGAALLRGLNIADLDDEEIQRIFWSLAQHLGTPVSQSAHGERILPVRDGRFADNDSRVRGPHTNRRLGFHTDRCDVIAFLCVRPARAGGETQLISSATLFNEMLRRHPAQLRVLQQPFPYLRHTIDSGNQRPFTMLPVFAVHDGHFAASFLRVLIDRADATAGAPDLTVEQREALDTLEEVAEDPALYARFSLEPGDILLLNNWTTFHRRTAFEDHDDPDRRRLLWRLWLSVPNSRPIDPRFAEHFGSTQAGALRGGIWPDGGAPRSQR